VSSGVADNPAGVATDRETAGARARRIVIVAEFVDPTRNSTGYYWHKIIKGLAALGHEVVVVSTAASCRLSQPIDGPVRWQPIPKEVRYNNDAMLPRILGQFRLAWALTMTARGQLRAADVLFCGTNPPFLLVMLSLLRRLRNFRLVMLVHDVFPENTVAAGLISAKAPLYRSIKWIYDRTYAGADALIAIGRDMVETLQVKTRGRTAIHYVPNWVDTAEILTEATARVPSVATPSPERVLFQYFGNLGRVQGLDGLLAAIREVQHPRASFLFIGSGAMSDQVKAFAAADPSQRVRVLPPLEFRRNNEGLLACDIALITLSPGMKGLAVPSKAYFSMAADKPVLVIGDAGSELDLLLDEHPEVGWHCQSGDPRTLARLIDTICDDNLKARRGVPRGLVERQFDCAEAVQAYIPILFGGARP
jgi:glycosyltransferase involved in cell wall biosynthesis